MTSRSRHLQNKDGCKQQHALHQAMEAKKQEQLKQKQIDGLLQGTGSSARQPRDRRRALGGPTKQGGELGQTGGAEFESGLVFWPTGVHGSVLLEFLSPTKPSHGKHKGARRSEQEPSRTKSCVQIAVVYKKLALASPAIDFF